MSDSIILNGPNGSSINIASFLLADPGPDFGETDLLKAAYSENPAAEGGVLAFETVNIRRMQFPLRIASMSALGGAAGAQAWFRTLARPGATLDVQLDGVPSAESVRFDVGAGRLEMAQWDTFKFTQLDRMDATLKLDTQPYGYWPTMILLASSASIGGPGVLSIPLGGSIFGDAPGLAEVFIAPTSATAFGAGLQKTDSVYWSFGARASFQAWWVAASGVLVGSQPNEIPTILGDQFAPASQTIRYHLASSNIGGGGVQFYKAGWKQVVSWVVPPALEPAYRGRFRAYTWARLGPSQLTPVYASFDVTGATTLIQPALGSAAPIATLPPAVGSGLNSPGASPAYHLLDLGEISLPAVASQPGEVQMRLWMTGPTTNPALTATGLVDIAGLYLQPLDGAAGVLPRGILQPTYGIGSPMTARLLLSSVTGDVSIQSATSAVASPIPIAAGGQFYRGVLPRIGASTLQFDLNIAGRSGNSDSPSQPPPIRSEPHFAQVSVRYRPRFAFMKGI